MQCEDCKLDIEGTYFEVGGKTVCKKDYEEVNFSIFDDSFRVWWSII
jgi:hypothetical protein